MNTLDFKALRSELADRLSASAADTIRRNSKRQLLRAELGQARQHGLVHRHANKAARLGLEKTGHTPSDRVNAHGRINSDRHGPSQRMAVPTSAPLTVPAPEPGPIPTRLSARRGRAKQQAEQIQRNQPNTMTGRTPRGPKRHSTGEESA